MKVIQVKPDFQPVTIVLESEEELRAVRVAMYNLAQNGTNQLFQTLCSALHQKLSNIS